MKNRRTVAALTMALIALAACAPETPTLALEQEQPARDLKSQMERAAKASGWDDPAEPIHIAGPLYFVGTLGLSSWLFATKEGHILLNTGTPKSGPLIAASIRKLGFKPEEIRVIINGHAHFDHAGAFAWMKELSGAQVAIMEGDVAVIEDGGKSDFLYGKDWQVMGHPPVKVDRVLRDGDEVRLGDVALTGLHTPGHTRGATTWITHLVEKGKSYVVVFPDGGGFNSDHRVTGPDSSYPGIEDDFRRTLHAWEGLKPDIWLTYHTEQFDMAGRRARAAGEGVAAWVDAEGYRTFVAEKRRAFEDEVAAAKKREDSAR